MNLNVNSQDYVKIGYVNVNSQGYVKIENWLCEVQLSLNVNGWDYVELWSCES